MKKVEIEVNRCKDCGKIFFYGSYNMTEAEYGYIQDCPACGSSNIDLDEVAREIVINNLNLGVLKSHIAEFTKQDEIDYDNYSK